MFASFSMAHAQDRARALVRPQQWTQQHCGIGLDECRDEAFPSLLIWEMY
jgi:phosphopantetheinyl transferase